MNRHAFIFTSIAFVAAAVAISLMVIASSQSSLQNVQGTHILAADQFLGQLEKDLPRVLFITGYRGLIGLEEHVSTTGRYLNNFSDPFIEVVTNGSVNGTSYEVMENATLTEYTQRMQGIAGQMGYVLNITFVEVELSHIDPFEVRMEATVQLSLTTRSSSTYWRYNKSIEGIFSIEQLKDPLYTVDTLGRVPTVITMVNVTRPYIDATNDTTNLQLIVNNSQYVHDTSGPSFLMRFVGNLSPDPNGLASLVDTKVLDSQDLVVNPSLSVVDFIYFSNTSTSNNLIVNMPDEFILDDAHLALFDAVGKTR